MATRFEDEFPRGGEFDSGYTTAPPPPPAASGLYGVQQEDPVAAIIESLMAQMKPQEVPKPPQVRPAQAIFGALGDAFANWGNIRAGGQGGQGPFAAGMERRRQEYEAKKAAAEKYNTDIDNQARMLIIGHKLKMAEREFEKANAATPYKDIVRDVNGEPHIIRQFMDPKTHRTLYEEDQGVQGAQPWIQPAIPGVSPPVRVPRGGAPGEIEGTVTPPPTAETAKETRQATSMMSLSKDALSSYRKYVSESTRKQRAGTSAGRKVPVIGGLIEEHILSYSDPEGVNVATKIDNVADMLLRLRSGAQINEQEYRRLRSLLPQLGENPETALAKFERFEDELMITLRFAYARAPVLFTDEVFKDLGVSREDILKSRAGRHESDSASKEPPPEIQRLRELE